MGLDKVARGQHCRINTVLAEDSLRLRALGLTPGSSIQVLRRAPLGDPIQLKVGRTLLSIRAHEAGMVDVDLIP